MKNSNNSMNTIALKWVITTTQIMMAWYAALMSPHAWLVDQTGDAHRKHVITTQIGVIRHLWIKQCCGRGGGVNDIPNGGGGESNSKMCSRDIEQRRMKASLGRWVFGGAA
jgi:hypothetical protein